MKKLINLFLILLLPQIVAAKTFSGIARQAPGKHAPDKGALLTELKRKVAAGECVGSGKALSFMENKGQVTDQHHQQRHDIQYKLAAADGLNIFIGSGAIHYQFSKCDNPEALKGMADTRFSQPGQVSPEPVSYSMYRMDVELVGANKKAQVVAEGQRSYQETYFTSAVRQAQDDNGEDGATAHTWNRITYKDVYPHIDWVFYISASAGEGKQGALKHEFVVHAGGRVSDIKLKYGGATSLRLVAGALTAATPQGAITEQAPYTYQLDGREVPSAFKLTGNILSYETDAYEGDLVIDPTLAWATYYGGLSSDISQSVAVDGAGNAWIAGYTSSTTDIATTGAYDETFGGYSDAFLVKFNSAGVRQWATYYGGTSDDHGNSVAVDGAGNAWMTGYTESETGIATAGAHDETHAGGYDAFLVKFNNAGGRQWATYYGGTGGDFGNSVAVDGAGNAWLAGNTQSGTGIATVGAHDETLEGYNDAFLVKFNNAGVRQWATYYGGPDSDNGQSVAIDETGNVWMAGTTLSTADIATVGAHDETLGGVQDAFLIKFNSAGVRQWATYYGGTDTENGYSLAVDGDGNAWLVGATGSFTNIASSGAHDVTRGGSTDAFLVKFNSVGGRQWGTYYGGGGLDWAISVATDGAGNAWLAGLTQSSADIATSGAHDETLGGSTDAFLVKFNSAGLRQWATYCGADGSDVGNSVAVDMAGDAWITGYTQSSTGIATTGAHDETFEGGPYDAFLAKFNADVPCTTPPASTGTLAICNGATTTLSNTTAGGTWSSSNAAVASVGTSGVVTGNAAGTANITYSMGAGCTSQVVVTVNALPTVGSTGGGITICDGATATLSGTGATSYSWSGGINDGVSFTPAVGVNTYTVTGTDANGCANTATVHVSVNASPAAISGSSVVSVPVIGNIVLVAGNGTSAYGGDGGPATSANLKRPISAVSDAAGNIYIADRDNYRIRKVDAITGTITTIAGTGTQGLSGDGGQATAAQIHVEYLAIDASNNLYFTQSTIGYKVRKINLATGIVTNVAGNGTQASTGDGGQATNASLFQPMSICIDPSGNLIIADLGARNIRRVDATTGIITAFAGTGASGSSGDGGLATAATFTSLNRVTSDAAGNIYTTDGGANNIRKINTSGIISLVAGIPTPYGAVADAASNVYVAELTNNRIRLISATGVISTIAGNGTDSNTGDGSPATASTIHWPASVSFDPSGNLIFASLLGDKVRKIFLTARSGCTVCAGSSITLSNATSGGTWSASNGNVTLSGTASTTVTAIGVSGGTVNISYTLASGCYVVTVATVNALPSVSAGANVSICTGNSTTLTASGATTYIWSPATGLSATTGASVTASPTVTTTYTVTGTNSNGCSNTATKTVSVNTVSAGSGIAICNGSSTEITATGGSYYSWSPATGLSATTGTSVTASPTVTTTYTVTGSTSSLSPSVIYSQAFSSSSPGGVSSAQGIAWNTFRENLVSTNVYSGFTIRGTYSPTGVSCTDPTVAQAIAEALRTGYSYDGSSDGHTWHVRDCDGWELSMDYPCSCDATYVLRPENAYYYGAANTSSCSPIPDQTLEVEFQIGGGASSCTNTATLTVTVNPLTDAGTITGADEVVAGSGITLTASVSGGAWSASNTNATVSGGVVTGVTAGTSIISYIVSGSCGNDTVTKLVTITTATTPITGALNACVGSSTSLSHGTAGGVWTSSDIAVATVNAGTGLVSGIMAGTATISYTYTGITVSVVVTISATPAAIGGLAGVCPGATTLLTHSSAGGTWSSSNVSVATVSATGTVSGITSGTAAVTYMISAACYRVKIMNVYSMPTPISGPTSICVGSSNEMSSTLYSSTGIWSSAETTSSVIDETTGYLTGIAAGTNTITYTTSEGCYRTLAVTVNSLPEVITGTGGICEGSTTLLSSATSGGTWVSGNVTTATVSGTGLVNGISAGTVSITYTSADGCRRKRTVTVEVMPSVITGVLTVCTGNTTMLNSATTGATWSSAASGIATVDAGTGLVSGISPGTAGISYSNGSCYRTVVVTVNVATAASTGTTLVCAGQAATLSNATGGGTWSSSNTAAATVHAASGLVTGIGAGTTNITYALSGGCNSITEVTVNAAMGSIAGTTSACIGSSTTLSHSAAGGVWSSSNVTRATIDAGTGILTGVSGGSATISYVMSAGCLSTVNIMVYGLPNTIGGGSSSFCLGGGTSFSCTPGGGTWSSSNTGVATIGSTGVIASVSAGASVISYTLGTGCASTRTLTVLASPSAITGSATACIGSTTVLGSTPTGGVWASSAPSKATVVAATGVVTGVATGNATITYTLATGCRRTVVVTVVALPGAIGGVLTLCSSCSTTLTSATTGGTWSSANTGVATVNSSTGVVSGVGAGTATISYTAASGCARTAVVTVSAPPSSITGFGVVCVGQTNATIAHPVSGGTWSSSNLAIARVHATNGMLTGYGAGNANITYTTSPGVYTFLVATVSAMMSPNVGGTTICPGATTTLTNATSGGNWSSSNILKAAVDAGTGVVTGVTGGTASVSYVVNLGCYRVSTITVNSAPNTTGATTVVNGTSTAFGGSPGGGTWTSANPAIASVSVAGVVTGNSVAATNITYTLGTGCFSIRPINVLTARPDSPMGSGAAQASVLTVYPNPTSGTLTIDAPVAGMFTVYTIDGKQLTQYNVTASANMVSLPQQIAAGIYMCRFMGTDGSTAIVRLVYEP